MQTCYYVHVRTCGPRKTGRHTDRIFGVGQTMYAHICLYLNVYIYVYVCVPVSTCTYALACKMSISFCIFVFACVFVCICVIRNCSNMRVHDRACAHHDLRRYMYLRSSVQWVAVGGDENNLSSMKSLGQSWVHSLLRFSSCSRGSWRIKWIA